MDIKWNVLHNMLILFKMVKLIFSSYFNVNGEFNCKIFIGIYMEKICKYVHHIEASEKR